MPMRNGRNGLAGARASSLTLPIEHLDAVDHVQGGRARFELMVWNIQRRVPESHDRIADVFVDGSFVIDDRVRERVKQPVHQRREALRVVLVGFGNCGKASHVAKQDGHLALFPTQHELLRRLRQLLDERGSKILAEGVADLAALCLYSLVGIEGDDCGHDTQDHGWIRWIEQDVPISKCGPSAHQD